VIKLFAFLKRRDGLTQDEFRDAWRSLHAPRVLDSAAFSRVRRYVQNDAILEPGIEAFAVSAFDGVGELWFDSADDLAATLADPSVGAVVEPSLDRFTDRAAQILVAAEESIQFDRGFGTVKFLGLSRRPAGFTHEEWVRYWIDVHGPMAHDIPEFTRYYGRYVHNYVVSVDAAATASTEDYDGVVEEWVRSVDDFAACLKEPRYLDTVRPDEQKFVDIARSHFVLATEHVVVP
jgi:hypothetical protein